MKAHKRILVGKNLAYAASLTSASANAARNPVDLAEGSIGIYAIDPSDSKFKLVTDGAVAGCVADTVVAAAKGKFVIAVGRASGEPLVSQELEASANTTYVSKAYTAGAKQVQVVGYNGVSTSTLNFPSLTTERNQGQITIQKQTIDTGERQPGNKQTFEYVIGSTGTAYEFLVGILNNHGNRNTIGAYGNDTLVDIGRILHNGTGSAIDNTATVAAVNGETSLTTSAAHSVGVGDWVSLAGDLYQAITGTTGSTLVLDRPYNGVTATIANADAIDLGATVPTKVGIEFVAEQIGDIFDISVDGIIKDATIKVTTDSDLGHGRFLQVSKAWKDNVAMLGSFDNRTSYMRFPDPEFANTNYDVYQLTAAHYPQGTQGSVFNVKTGVDVYYPTNSNGGSQAEFEDIVGQLIKGSDGLGGLHA